MSRSRSNTQGISMKYNKMIGERARPYQGCTNSSWCGCDMYIRTYVCHNSSACHVLWGGIMPQSFFVWENVMWQIYASAIL